MAVRGDSADLVRRAGAGIVCEPESPQALATAVKRMYHMPREELICMGQNGRKYYEQELSLHAGVKKFVEIFESVQRRR